MAVRELHVALRGVAGASAGAVRLRLEVAVYRSDGDPVFDGLTPTIPIKVAGVYLTPAEINAAILAAAKDELADPDGWNVPAVYDFERLYGDVGDMGG